MTREEYQYRLLRLTNRLDEISMAYRTKSASDETLVKELDRCQAELQSLEKYRQVFESLWDMEE